MIRDLILIFLICASTASALNTESRIFVRRVGTARITPRPMRRSEFDGLIKGEN